MLRDNWGCWKILSVLTKKVYFANTPKIQFSQYHSFQKRLHIQAVFIPTRDVMDSVMSTICQEWRYGLCGAGHCCQGSAMTDYHCRVIA